MITLLDIKDLRGTVAGVVVAEWLREIAENGDNSYPYDKMLDMADYLQSEDEDDE